MCLHTQNLRQFPGFAVVVVTLFDEILDDFHVSLTECFSPRKSTTNFGVTVFFTEKVTNSIGRETKTHIFQTKINEQNSLKSAF